MSEIKSRRNSNWEEVWIIIHRWSRISRTIFFIMGKPCNWFGPYYMKETKYQYDCEIRIGIRLIWHVYRTISLYYYINFSVRKYCYYIKCVKMSLSHFCKQGATRCYHIHVYMYCCKHLTIYCTLYGYRTHVNDNTLFHLAYRDLIVTYVTCDMYLKQY